jgi:hypothetical protein
VQTQQCLAAVVTPTANLCDLPDSLDFNQTLLLAAIGVGNEISQGIKLVVRVDGAVDAHVEISYMSLEDQKPCSRGFRALARNWLV